jgi:hypothetical protein
MTLTQIECIFLDGSSGTSQSLFAQQIDEFKKFNGMSTIDQVDMIMLKKLVPQRCSQWLSEQAAQVTPIS